MSHVKTNFDSLLKSNARIYSVDEVAEMTTKQFDALPLSDQINIYHNHRAQYDRLTGKSTENTATNTSDGRSGAKEAIDEFESRWKAYMDAITAKKT